MKIKLDKTELTPAEKLLVYYTMKGVEKLNLLSDHAEQEVLERIQYELNCIIKMQFCDYFLIVRDYIIVGEGVGHMPEDRFQYLVDHMRDEAWDHKKVFDYIFEVQTEAGITTGPGRGSAAGSLVAYCLGITHIDPLKYGLLFERFLNPDRVSYPDIDEDFSSPDLYMGSYGVVDYYLEAKYGKDAKSKICTPSTLQPRAAVKAAASAYAAEETDNGDTLKYNSLAEEICRLIPNKPGIRFDDVKDELNQKYTDGPAKIIIDRARRLENVSIGFGTHACGSNIVGNGDIGEYCSLIWDEKSQGMKTAMNSEDGEEQGFLKYDHLKLKYLNFLTFIVRNIYKETGRKIDLYNIPEEPEVFNKVFAEGLTKSIFQMESSGMAGTFKDLGASWGAAAGKALTLEDLIMGVAIYRPGPMQYIPGIVSVRHGGKPADNAVSRIASYNKDFSDIVTPTYLSIVYQEQVMGISVKCAGFTRGESDILRKAMGHKKADVLEGMKAKFIPGAVEHGIKQEDAEKLFEEMMDFAKYSFNKSHAACYAVLAYMGAWLKYHYPEQFYTAAFEFEPQKKYAGLKKEAAEFGIAVKTPAINRSGLAFTHVDKDLYFGFNSIKSFEKKDAMEVSGKKFESISDFVLNTKMTESGFTKLCDAGFFDTFCDNRAALRMAATDYYKEKKDISKKQNDIETAEEMLADIQSGKGISREKYKIKTKSLPTEEKLMQKIDKAKASIEESIELIKSVIIPKVEPDRKYDIEKERELLGMYLTGSPLDAYEMSEDTTETVRVNDVMTLTGLIRDLRVVQTKKTKKNMCFFKLEDNLGSIDVVCFPKDYERIGSYIEENNAVTLTGKISLKEVETQYDENGEEIISDPEFQMVADKAAFAKEKELTYKMFFKGSLFEYMDKVGILKQYESKDGHVLQCFGPDGETWRTDFKVGDEILIDFEENIVK